MLQRYVSSTWFSRAKSLSPQKNCISGCVRFTSRLICSANSVSYSHNSQNQWSSWTTVTRITKKIKTACLKTAKRKVSLYKTWKNWCQTLLLPRLKGWSSWDISWRCRGPSNASSSAAFKASISSLFLVTSDCSHKTNWIPVLKRPTPTTLQHRDPQESFGNAALSKPIVSMKRYDIKVRHSQAWNSLCSRLKILRGMREYL